MKLETFFEKFELFADAPDAVAKMRELVLEFAVRGHLSKRRREDQADPIWKVFLANHESASGLGDSAPFSIPDEWCWVTLDSLGSCRVRNDVADALSASFVPMAMIPAKYGEPVQSESRPWGDIKKSFTHFADGDVVLAKITPCFENGKSAVVRGLVNGVGAGTTELHVFRRSSRIVLPEYVLLCIKSRGFISRGGAVMTGTAGQKRVPRDYFSQSPFPLPPPAEQKRIVAKVDDLMTLCDRLEARQLERETRHAALARASLARFAEAPTPANLEFLFHNAYDISPADLRKSILTLAVQGKLVPQDANDEPVSRVLAEGTKLPSGHVRRRKILKSSPIASNAIQRPDLPPSWEYAPIQRLYDLNLIIDYADGNHGFLYPNKSEFGTSGIVFVTARDIVGGQVAWASCARLNQNRAHQLTKGWAKGGDVLLTHNATVGRVARVEREVEKFLLGTSVTFYRLNERFISSDYFYHVLCSPVWQKQLEAIMEQTTRNQVSIQKQAFFQIPIPPVEEQHRIAAKVDELMALVDKLETHLVTARTTSTNLLAAAVAELTRGEHHPAVADSKSAAEEVA